MGLPLAELKGKRLLIGTPCYSGWLHHEYTKSLLETHACCAALGIEVSTLFLCQCARITRARHEIVRAFRNRELDYLLMIDSDIGWPADAPARLMAHDVPYVGAVTVKRGTDRMCLRNIGDDKAFDYDPERRLMRVGAMGTAFVMFKMELFEAMERAYPQLMLEEECGGHPPYALFSEMLTPEGDFNGEDYSFSLRAQAIGIDMFVDPWIPLTHTSERTYRGSLAEDMGLAEQVENVRPELAEAAD